MMKKEILIGAAAAAAVGLVLVGVAVSARASRSAPVAAASGAQMKITLVTPKEPVVVHTGDKLETVPPGSPNDPTETVRPTPAPQPRLARADPIAREPEAEEEDFVVERARPDIDRDVEAPYPERRERWRERRYDEGRRDREERDEPYYPEPPAPPWWRR